VIERRDFIPKPDDFLRARSPALPDDLHPHLQPTVDPSKVFDPDSTVDGTHSLASTVDHVGRLESDPSAPVIPGYTIAGELARGGMGVVYAARETKLNREVAIKTLLPSLHSHEALAARFVVEAEITARLPHPGVPPVHALGELEDGSPYLVMKLIRGRTLAELLKERSSPSEDHAKYVAVFEQIAQAVGFAHEQGIIHRDLKPLNVMVGAFGEVQVMDWGLAKDLASREAQPIVPEDDNADLSHTSAGQVMGTPGYMAPEQARGEPADARADVFALGATLAAILTGVPAFVGTTARETIQKAARGELGETLDRLTTCGADGELVELAKDCLAADAAARPADAKQVASRVADYRLGVEQRLKQAETAKAEALVREAEQSKRRRVMKWAAGIITVVLLAGVVGTSIGWNEAKRQTGVAKFEAGEKGKALEQSEVNLKQAKANLAFAKKGNELLRSVFAGLDPTMIALSGRPLQDMLRENLGKAANELEGSAIGEPLEVASMQDTLGTSLGALGAFRDAVGVLEKARRTYVALQGAEHPETLASAARLGAAYSNDGRTDEALPILTETLKLLKVKIGDDHPETLSTMSNLARTLRLSGKAAEAIPLYEQALEIMRVKPGPKDGETIANMNGLGVAYAEAGRRDDAFRVFKEAEALAKTHLGEDHPHTQSSVNNLASAHFAAGRLNQAIPLFEEAYRVSKKTLGADHPDALIKMTNLAACLLNVGDVEKAAPLFEQSLTLRRAKLGDDHPDTLSSMGKLAAAFWSMKKLDRSIPLFEEALKRQREKLGRDHPETLMTMANLGVNYADAGRPKDAVPMFEEVYRASAAVPSLQWVESPLLQAYAEANDRAKAFELIPKRLARARQSPDASQLAGTLASIGLSLLKMKEWSEAEKILRECHALRRKSQPDSWSTFNTQSQLGAALLGQKKYAEAEPILLEACQGLKQRETSIPSHSKERLVEGIDRLVELYTATNKPEEVAKWKAERVKIPPTKK
jgi:tetratricopeptide (TPR) repeat protein/tRNA A-37 threonylcarbamoyl transferase component Bud32